MDKDVYKKLLAGYLAGTLTEEQRAQVDQWLEATRTHDHEEGIEWDESRQERILDTLHQKIHAPAERVLWPLTTKFFLRAAASLLILALASYSLYRVLKKDIIQLAAAGNMTKTILTDGTIVWLKPHSALTYPEYFSGNERRVQLQGEALFEVAKDAEHPFIIQCGELTATVLGTSFNIRASADQIEVAVLTGKVALTSSHDSRSIIVLPQGKAVYSVAQQQISKTQSEPAEVNAITDHTEYNMNFHKTSVREIIKRMEGKFNVTVNTDSAAVKDCGITADFTDQSLEVTLRNMATLLEFEYTMKGDLVEIRGGTCQ